MRGCPRFTRPTPEHPPEHRASSFPHWGKTEKAKINNMQSRWNRLQAEGQWQLPGLERCLGSAPAPGHVTSRGGHEEGTQEQRQEPSVTLSPRSWHSPGLTAPGRTLGMSPWSGAGCCAKPTYGLCWGVPAPGRHPQHPSIFWGSGGSAGAGWGCSTRSADRCAEAGRALQQQQPLAWVRAGWGQHLQGARLSWEWAPRHTWGHRSPLEQLRPWRASPGSSQERQ